MSDEFQSVNRLIDSDWFHSFLSSQQYRVSLRTDNDDLFANVNVTSSLEIPSMCTVTTATVSKPRKRKKKLESKTIKRIFQKCQRSRKNKVRTGRRLENCGDETIKVKPSNPERPVLTTARNDGSMHTSFRIEDSLDTQGTSLQSSIQHNYNNQESISLILNQSSDVNFVNGGNESTALSGNDDVQATSISAMNIQRLVLPVIQDSPSAAQVAMLIVQSLAWDTVRMVRRSSYTEGFSIVLVKPKGMNDAPTLLAMQNSKGDLTIPCDSLSNQRALFKIVGLLGDNPMAGRS